MRRVSGQIIKCFILVVLAIGGLALLATCSTPTDQSLTSDNENQEAGQSQEDAEACSAEHIEDTLLEVHNLTREFDQVLFIAQNTPPSQLVSPLMKMQEIRHAAEQQKAPTCMQALRANRDNYMNATLIYMAHFMSSQEGNIQAEMAAAAKYQSDYKAELTRLLMEYDLEPVAQAPAQSGTNQLPAESPAESQAQGEEPRADASAAVADQQVRAGNASEMIVLLRALPDSEADIVGQIDPYQVVDVLARNEDGSWLQVACADAPNGIAWVDHPSVEISGDEASLPVVNSEDF